MTALHSVDWLLFWATLLLCLASHGGPTSRKGSHRRRRSISWPVAILGWWIIGAAVFSSNIGSEHLVGLAGSGATDGVAMAHYELHAWCLLVLAWVMVPFYMRSRVFTMPEFLERRFSPVNRTVLSIISLVAYVLTKLAVGIFAGGVVFAVLIPDITFMGLDSFWIGSIAGDRTDRYLYDHGRHAGGGLHLGDPDGDPGDRFGLRDVFRPEGPRRLGGAARVGRFGDVQSVEADRARRGSPRRGRRSRKTRMAWYFNDNYPWIGMLFCAPIIGLWYWCTDQYIVQRVLGAQNEQVPAGVRSARRR
jgi:solute:Na+ symporter, SSS family